MDFKRGAHAKALRREGLLWAAANAEITEITEITGRTADGAHAKALRREGLLWAAANAEITEKTEKTERTEKTEITGVAATPRRGPTVAGNAGRRDKNGRNLFWGLRPVIERGE